MKAKASNENLVIVNLALILSFRMLGLFMIYPIFAFYAPEYIHATPQLIGAALGIYGLTQALLQLPLSQLSDKLGRKPIIIGGLIFFVLGSILAASTNNIIWLIIGRGFQGIGAIGSTLIALAADLTPVENRTKAMSILGITIGLSFALAMVLGPLVNARLQLQGIFWLTAIFGLVSILIVALLIPTPKVFIRQPESKNSYQVLKTLLSDNSLLKLNVSILILHALLTASFAIIPLLLAKMGFGINTQWQVYLPILLIAFIITMPLLLLSEKKNSIKLAISLAILALAVANLALWRYHSTATAITIELFVFFTGFTLLEAILPSLISKIAPSQHKGTAMGIYSSFQFLGIFIGGMAVGFIRSHWNDLSIFFISFIIAILWLLYMYPMKNPPKLKTKLVPLSKSLNLGSAQQVAKKFLSIPGVIDAEVSLEDCIAYLKVDNKMFNETHVATLSLEST